MDNLQAPPKNSLPQEEPSQKIFIFKYKSNGYNLKH